MLGMLMGAGSLLWFDDMGTEHEPCHILALVLHGKSGIWDTPFSEPFELQGECHQRHLHYPTDMVRGWPEAMR